MSKRKFVLVKMTSSVFPILGSLHASSSSRWKAFSRAGMNEMEKGHEYICMCMHGMCGGMLNILYNLQKGWVGTCKKTSKEKLECECDVVQTLIEICCKSQSLK